jgi:hypothetical protein
MTSSVFWIGYISESRPFNEPKFNKLEIINDIFYYILLGLSFSFTMKNIDKDGSFKMGIVFMALLILLLVINCSNMLFG